MASSSNNTNTSQAGSKNQPSQVVAVYHFVIIDGRALRYVSPDQGVWISKVTSRKDYTYTARMVNRRWKLTFGCAYSDAGALESLEILAVKDSRRRLTDWESEDKAGGLLEEDPSQRARETLDKKVEELGLYPFPKVMLDAPSIGQNDDNGNKLLCFSQDHDPEGAEGGQQMKKLLWWAKKEVSGKPITALSEEELDRFRFDGRVEQMERTGPIEGNIPPGFFQRMPIQVDRPGINDWD